MKTIGQTILDERKRKGLTQQQLGAAVNISRNTVASIEKNSFNEVGIRKVEALLNQLGYTLSVNKLHRRPSLDDLKQQNFHDE